VTEEAIDQMQTKHAIQSLAAQEHARFITTHPKS
jgi:hypothetical protein